MIDRGLLERNLGSFMYRHRLPICRSQVGILRFVMLLTAMACVVGVPIVQAVVPAMPATTQSLFPKIVAGYVYSSMGAKVGGVSVTVKMINGGTTTDTQSATSTAEGFYSVVFDKSVWDVGYTIRVEVSKNALTGSNETLALSDADLPVQYVNATLGTEIPEFGCLWPVVGGSALVILLASFRLRGKKP